MSVIDSEHFSLRWNNFHSNMTTEFHSLLEGEDLVDVTLAADGRFTQAHKIVLSVCSPYFKELFKVNPCKHPIVILKDVGHKELTAILQFMYKGEVNVSQEDFTAFLRTAELLQIKGLTGDDSGSSGKVSSQLPSMSRSHRGETSGCKNINSKPQNLVKSRISTSMSSSSSSSLDNHIVSQTPPYKRARLPDGPPLSDNKAPQKSPTEEVVDNSKPLKSELINPKEEPVDDYDTLEEDDNDHDNLMLNEESRTTGDPVTRLMKVDLDQTSTSHSGTEGTSLPASVFASVSTLGLPQDSGGTQDNIQGLLRKPRRIPKLIHSGFKYVREWSAEGNESWVCCEYRRWDCRARCTMVAGEVVNISNDRHNHAPHYTDKITALPKHAFN